MTACPECGATLGSDHRFCPFDGTPIAGEEESLIGKVVADRYRIVGRLGEGGMATIYLARHEHLHRDVALKVLHPQMAAQSKLLARFAREGRAASRIDHDNVVYVLDFGRSDQGMYFLVMEHVVGRALEAEIAQCGRISPARTTHILAQIGAAVARAHDLGIVHRDLKCDNVLLCHRGRDEDFVKVLDFGLAKLVEPEDERSGRKLTSVGEIFGTPEYMAPEQWNGQPADARTDIYAMGIIAHQMLTGRLPFEGATPMALMFSHCNARPPVPSETLPGRGIPVVYDEIVRTCLAKDPADRYPSMGAFLEALGGAWPAVDTGAVSAAATTYAGTLAAPPPPPPDAIPDPTVYRTADMDVMHDGPALYAEIDHLHRLRRRRAREVVQLLWKDGPPARVRELEASIEALERSLEETGQEIALLRSLSEEAGRVAGEERAHLREDMMDASLVVSGLTHLVDDEPVAVEADLAGETIRPPSPPSFEEETLPTDEPGGAPEVAFADLADRALARDVPDDSLAETLGDGEAPSPRLEDAPQPASHLHRAERRLASFERKHLREVLDIEQRLTDQLDALRRTEDALAPLYEELAALVSDVAASSPSLRGPVVAYEQVDGALASYKALLDLIET